MAQQYTSHQLIKFVSNVFQSKGMPEAQAYICAEGLVAADLRGIDSHGVARLSGYLRLIDAGRLNPTPTLKVLHETPSTATIDADSGSGLYAGQKAIELAIDKAKTAGSGWVAVGNSNHFGIAAHHAMRALPHHMIGIAMTNASPLVSPPSSAARMLGTNPICIAIPAQKFPHLVLDMATSTAANGKLEIAQRQQKAVPMGWIVDQEGSETSDPDALKKGGALLPLGSDPEHGIHKGFGMGAMVDILSAMLSGANYGPWVPPFVSFLPVLPDIPGKGLGHFFGVMRVDAFRPLETYYKHIDHWIDTFKNTAANNPGGRVILPGEPENQAYAERINHGIPLHEAVINDLISISKETSIPLT
jgi:LDH2 family malate/lactate/ureidoglycolate dehydrogenase